MFRKVYVEITNICNLSCTFCHGTKRAPRTMTPEEFSLVAERLRGHTRYIYLHLLGEPLLHPQLPELLRTAEEKGFHSCITTNGFLLPRMADALCCAGDLYRLSVSLHSFEANSAPVGLTQYLDGVWDAVCRLAAKGTYCVLRLWNEGGENSLNGEIGAYLHAKTGQWQELRSGSLRIAENIYLESAQKFDWPDTEADERKTSFCLGLRDQIGILCDGTVVPCCLDADGVIALGNIFDTELDGILASPRASAMYKGFSERRCTEELCRRCGFAERFGI